MDLPPPPLPAANATRPRQMALNEAAVAAAAAARGWDNGIGGYQTNSMLETRIAGNSNGQHVTHEGMKKIMKLLNPFMSTRVANVDLSLVRQNFLAAPKVNF